MLKAACPEEASLKARDPSEGTRCQWQGAGLDAGSPSRHPGLKTHRLPCFKSMVSYVETLFSFSNLISLQSCFHGRLPRRERSRAQEADVGAGGRTRNFPPCSPSVPHTGTTGAQPQAGTELVPGSKSGSLHRTPWLPEGRECERGQAQTLPGTSLAI